MELIVDGILDFFFFFKPVLKHLIILPRLQKSVVFLKCLGEEKKLRALGLESVSVQI